MKRFLLPFVAFVALAACLAAAARRRATGARHQAARREEGGDAAAGRPLLADREFPRARAGTIGRRRVGAGDRVGGQGLAVHARRRGRLVARRRQGRRGRADPARRRRRIPSAHQRGQRPAGQLDAGALASRLRGLLRPRRRAEHSRRSRDDGGQGRATRGRPRAGAADADVEQRRDRPAGAGDVHRRPRASRSRRRRRCPDQGVFLSRLHDPRAQPSRLPARTFASPRSMPMCTLLLHHKPRRSQRLGRHERCCSCTA